MGRADVLVDGPHGEVKIAELAENAIVGEIAILCDKARTASMRAVTTVEALRISTENFMKLLLDFPEMPLEVVRVLAERRSRTTVELTAACGSTPVGAVCFLHSGGNFMCFYRHCGDMVMVFDAGSGLPIFAPLHVEDGVVKMWSGHQGGNGSTGSMIEASMRKPFFRVGPEVFCAQVTFEDLTPGAVGCRVAYRGHEMAVVFNPHHQPVVRDPVVMDLIRDVHFVQYDATFTDAEFPTSCDFGQSRWQKWVRLAQAARAARVGFVHHATFRIDHKITGIKTAANQQFAEAFCARDTQTLRFDACQAIVDAWFIARPRWLRQSEHLRHVLASPTRLPITASRQTVSAAPVATTWVMAGRARTGRFAPSGFLLGLNTHLRQPRAQAQFI